MANPDNERQIGIEKSVQTEQTNSRPHRFTVHPETGVLIPPGNPKTLKRLGAEIRNVGRSVIDQSQSSGGVESQGPDVKQDLVGFDLMEIELGIADGEAHGYSADDPTVDHLIDEWQSTILAAELEDAPAAVIDENTQVLEPVNLNPNPEDVILARLDGEYFSDPMSGGNLTEGEELIIPFDLGSVLNAGEIRQILDPDQVREEAFDEALTARDLRE